MSTPTHGSTEDPKDGILADLEALRSTRASQAEDAPAPSPDSLLDSIANAASHLREGDASDGAPGSADSSAKAPRRRARTTKTVKAAASQDAESDTAPTLSSSLFSNAAPPQPAATDAAQDSEDRGSAPAPRQRRSRSTSRTQDAAAAPVVDKDSQPNTKSDEPASPEAQPAPLSDPFSPFSQVFSAVDTPVTYAPVAPAAGNALLFQAPQAELGQKVDPDWSDDEDDLEDTADDTAHSTSEDDSDSEQSGQRESRGGRSRGRGRRSQRSSEDEPETSESDDDDNSEDSGEESEGRRRRRGGRGRRSRKDEEGTDSSSNDSSGKNTPQADSPAQDADAASAGDDSQDNDDSDDDASGSRRRRRRSRTSGRSSRSSDTSEDAVQGVKGSTRLEAKRQRRREGREAGRRRPIISEAEFLARREAVDRTMLVREQEGRTQLCVLEDGIAVEHYLSERKAQASLIGNVYLGKVQNVLPSMEAAFIDIGKGRNAVLYAGEVNWDALGMDGKPRKIEKALSSGDSVLVQVTKDPIGHKGARLTSQISLPGRFLVYVPGNSMTGISRKLPDVERQRLKKLLKEIVPENAGVIVRTAAEGASEEDISHDVERLTKRWDKIEKKSTSTKVLAPQLLYSEPDMIVRIVRDVFNEDFGKLVIEGDSVWETIYEYVDAVAPDLVERLERYSGDADIFDSYRVNEQIDKAMSRKVNLPSGGSLVIDRTEAMTVIDVNTGKFTGSGGNLEETVTKNNLEAAEEVIRQLRLRDIGGIIVVDFIDMVLESNRDLVVRRLVECLGRDRTKHQVAEVTSLGLVQMTRKRIGTGLAESFAAAGEDLQGMGLMLPGTEPEPHSNKGHQRNKRRRGDGDDRQRGNDAAKTTETTPAESPEDSEKQTATRSAMAAIAKATLQKEAEAAAEAAQESDSSQGSDAAHGSDAAQRSDSAKGSESADAPRSRGARRSKKQTADSEAQSSNRAAAEKPSDAQPADSQRTESKRMESHDTGSQQADSASVQGMKATTVPAKAAPVKPSGPAPLMIGADSQTRVQTKAPTATRAKKAAAKDSAKELGTDASTPAPEAPAAPPILILGQD